MFFDAVVIVFDVVYDVLILMYCSDCFDAVVIVLFAVVIVVIVFDAVVIVFDAVVVVVIVLML